MRFAEELQHLSELLRTSAETILQISDVRVEDRAQLGSVAIEVEILADRLMVIGSRAQPSLRH